MRNTYHPSTGIQINKILCFFAKKQHYVFEDIVSPAICYKKFRQMKSQYNDVKYIKFIK